MKKEPDFLDQKINLYVSATWLKQIDDWRRRQPELPNFSESIRQLVELGLLYAKKERQ
jgi:hypothetical protein